MTPKKKEEKPIEELTDDEVMKRLFGKKAAKKLKEIVHSEHSKKPGKGKRPKPQG